MISMTNNITIFLKNIGSALKDLRKVKGIKAKSIYEAIEIDSSYYSYLENTSKYRVSMFIYLDISRYLEVPFSSILKRVENSNEDPQLLSKTGNKIPLNNKVLTTNICNEFFKIRKSKGYTQRYVAQLMGVTAKYYNDIELGNYLSTSLYRYKEVALALDTPLYEIVEKAEYATINELKSKNTKHDS
jgi:transcriptional regulator with XRE-family HTH domain